MLATVEWLLEEWLLAVERLLVCSMDPGRKCLLELKWLQVAEWSRVLNSHFTETVACGGGGDAC